MAQKYKNIPVKPEVYAKVVLVADLNHRGLGDQVANWAERELPECAHKKQAVTIERFNESQTDLAPASVVIKGWYCPTCKRVYSKVAEEVES